MELGLSLGGSSKPLKFLEKRCEYEMQGGPSVNGGPNFGMALGLKASSGENEKTQKKSQESEDDDDEEPNTSEEERTDVVGPVQLNLLPGAPVPHRKTLPWFSDNGSSENGSSGNMGVAAARGPAEEASSANSMFRLEFAGRRDLDGGGQSDAMGSSRASDDDDSGPSCRKKLRLSKQQSAFLEETFKDHNTLNPKQKQALAKQLNLRPRQVEVWFQNRRARTKLKQTEVDCEYLKRCCETLTDENRRLQRELHELRALKISAPFYMHSPATTLTMCPSCERIASAAPPPSAAAAGGGKIPKMQDVPASSPFALDRPKFFPFSQSSFGHPPNRPPAS